MPPRTAPAAPAPAQAASTTLAVAKAKMQEKHAAQRKRFHEALGGVFDSADDFDLECFDFNDPLSLGTTEMDLLFKYPLDATTIDTTLDTTIDIAPNSRCRFAPKRFCSDFSDPSDNNDSDNDSSSSASSSSTSSVWPVSDSDLDELCDLLADVSDTELDVMTANLMNTTLDNNNNDMTTDELPPIPPTPPPSEGTATEPPTRYDTPEPTPPEIKSKFLESLGPNVKLIAKCNAKRKMITKRATSSDDDAQLITQIVPFKEMRIHDVKTAALRIAVLLDLDDQLRARPSPGEMLRNWCEGNDAPPLGSRNMRAHMRFIRTNGDFCKYMAKKTVDVFPPEFKTRVDECEAFLRGMPDYTPQVAMV